MPKEIAIRTNEAETRSRLIRPALTASGWSDIQIREEYPYTLGRIHVSGKVWKRRTSEASERRAIAHGKSASAK